MSRSTPNQSHANGGDADRLRRTPILHPAAEGFKMPMHTTTMNNRSRSGLATLALAGVATLSGCLPENQPIQVSLNNRTQSSITAMVVLEQCGERQQTLARTPIPAGESRNLGPFAPPSSGRLELIVNRDDQFSDVPTRRSLKPGDWSFRVVRPVFSTYSSIELKEEEPGENEWEWAPRSLDAMVKGRKHRDF